MNDWALSILCCPFCGGEVFLQASALNCSGCGKSYPVVDGIPRFVGSENYCSNFSRQWNTFNTTQIDTYSGTKQSEERFKSETG